jgi:hypothetical protein
MATARAAAHHEGVLTATLLPLVVVGILAVGLRLSFGTGRTPAPERQPGQGYGLLRPVATVPTQVAAQVLCRRLADADIRATTAPGPDGRGHQVLVFPADETNAKLVLAG